MEPLLPAALGFGAGFRCCVRFCFGTGTGLALTLGFVCTGHALCFWLSAAFASGLREGAREGARDVAQGDDGMLTLLPLKITDTDFYNPVYLFRLITGHSEFRTIIFDKKAKKVELFKIHLKL